MAQAHRLVRRLGGPAGGSLGLGSLFTFPGGLPIIGRRLGLALAFLLLAVAAEAEHAEWGFRGWDASDWDESGQSVRARFRTAGYGDGGERDP